MPFKLKKEAVLRPFGPNSEIKSDSLTDEIAVFHLSKSPEDIEKFEDNKTRQEWIESNSQNPGTEKKPETTA